MNFGLISDIHANLPALEAILAELDADGVEEIFDAGDMVFYGPFPNEVICLSRKRKVVSVQGNRDRGVCEFPCKSEKYRASLHPLRFRAYEWTYNTLTAENLSYLRSLPEYLSITINSHRLLMVHDRISPEAPQLRLSTPDSEFERAAAMVEEDVIIFGHTHIPFARKIAGKLFVNTGSVGRPGDADPRAGYVLLTIEAERAEAQIRRVSYDVDRTVKAVYNSDLPNELALMFIQGKKLDDIRAIGMFQRNNHKL